MGKYFDKTFNLYMEKLVNSRKLQSVTGSYRKRQNLLADYDRADPNYPQQLERLKKQESGKMMITSNTFNQILKIYNIKDINENNPRKLGNTGITLSIENGNYFISK